MRALKLPGIHFVAEPKRFYPEGPPRLRRARLRRHRRRRAWPGSSTSTTGRSAASPGEIVALTDARRSRYGEAETASSRPAAGGRLARALARLGRAVRRRARARRGDARAPREVGQRRRDGSLERRDPRDGLRSGLRPERVQPLSRPRSRRNRVIADAYEPGSTFKIVTGALALENGLVSLDEIIDTGDGTIRVANTTIQESEAPPLRRADARAASSSTPPTSASSASACVWARGASSRAPSAFGVGRPTGVDLPGENTGIFRPLPRWSGLSNAVDLDGTGSVAQRAAARAHHRGRRQRRLPRRSPHLVTRIVEPGGASARRARAGAVARPLARRRPQAISRILVGVVEHGTGTQGRDPGLLGRRQDGHRAEGRASAGTRPAATSPTSPASLRRTIPRCVAVVVLEEPQGKYYAAEVAAPLFARVDVAGARHPPRRAAGAAGAGDRARRGAGPAASPRYARRRRAASARRASRDGPRRRRKRAGRRRALSASPRARPSPSSPAPGVLARLQGSGFVVAQDPPPGSPVRAGLGPHPLPRR